MNEELTERAQRAVRVFRSMQFGLTSYARALSRNRNISIEVTEGGARTDGQKIYIRPPIALGDDTKHSRMDCDKRDENLQLICQACFTREEVLVNIYHEIGHIAFDSFAKLSEKDKKLAFEKAADNSNLGKAENHLQLAALVNPFLPKIIQVLDDVRVDSTMFRVRPGVKTMLTASTWALFNDGIEHTDGQRWLWRDAPLNAQATIACYLAGVGYDGWQKWLHPTIGEAFADPELDELMRDVRDSVTISDVFGLSFDVLDRLRELGFFKTEEEQDEQQSDEGLDGERGEETSDPSSGAEAGETGGDREEGLGADEVRGSESSDSGEESSDSEGTGEPEEGDELLDEEEQPSDSDPISGEPGDRDSAGSDASDAEGTGNESDSKPDLPQSESGEGSGSSEDDSEYSEFSDSGSSPTDEGQATPSDVDDDSEAEGESTGSAGSDQDSSSTESDAEDSSSSGDEGTESDESGSESAGSENTEQLASDEVIDTGADQGKGGIELPEYGTSEEVAKLADKIHQQKDIEVDESGEEKAAIAVAVTQGLYFEKPSVYVGGVREHKFNSPLVNTRGQRMDTAWSHAQIMAYMGTINADVRKAVGIDVDLDIPESIMGPALLQTRRVFTDNAIAAHQHNMKSGRINRKVLGRRAWNDDNRLFSKKRLPGKRSYAVVIGIDISGSTIGANLALAKRAAGAQAELCERAGVDFAVYAHTASAKDGTPVGGNETLWLDMYEIKTFSEPWDKDRRHRLAEIGPNSDNLDGHGLEYYRKRLDEVNATDKILLYYSDGKMPAANYAEELEVLQREIKICKQKGYVLLGVGIRTDSPKRHGLDTVQVNDDEDLKSVVMHLERRLVASGR